ncbi:MAG: hypothetical protein RhofKO_17090 [Rhodothermales bacterium]
MSTSVCLAVYRLMRGATLLLMIILGAWPQEARGQAPANEEPASATVITATTFTDANVELASASASAMPAANSASCGGGAAPNIFYRVTPTFATDVTVHAGEGARTIVVYASEDAVLTQAEAQAVSATPNNNCEPRTMLTFAAEAGTRYYIAIALLGPGPTTADVTITQAPPPPANDLPENATVVSTPTFSDANVNMASATSSVLPASNTADCSSGSAPDLFYRFQPTTAREITVSVSGDGFVLFYESDDAVFTQAENEVTTVSPNNLCAPTSTTATLTAQAGVSYYAAVITSVDATVSVQVTQTPLNDAPEDATELTTLPLTESDVPFSGAEQTSVPAADVAGCTSGRGDVFYRFTPTTRSRIRVVVDEASIVLFYASSDATLTQAEAQAVAVTPNNNCEHRDASVPSSLVAEPGVTYYIAIAGFRVREGTITITEAPLNDEPSEATVVTANSFTETDAPFGSATNSSVPAADTPGCLSGVVPDLFYRITPSLANDITVSLDGASGIIVFYASDDATLTQAEAQAVTVSPNNNCVSRSTATLTAEAGTSYYVAVGVVSGSPAPDVTIRQRPRNDAPEDALLVTSSNFSQANVAFSQAESSSVPAANIAACPGAAPFVFYRFTAGAAGTITVGHDGSGTSLVLFFASDDATLTQAEAQAVNVSPNNNCQLRTSATLTAEAGVTYYVALTSTSDATVTLASTVALTPANDTPVNALHVTEASFVDANVGFSGAQSDGVPAADVANCTGVLPDVFYRFTPVSAGEVTVDLSNTGGPQVILFFVSNDAVLTQAEAQAVTVAPNNACTTKTSATLTAEAGVSYYLAVGSTIDTSVRFTSTTALPVEFTDFVATTSGERAHLAWETASETNNAGFHIEHATSASDWITLSFLPGHGTTLEAQRYTYTAEDLVPGTHRFRLRQVDYDGTFGYSPEVEVSVEMAEAFRLSPVYPNPFNPEASVTLSVRERQQVTVTVHDLLGREVAHLFDGELAGQHAHLLRLDGSRWTSGLYVVRVVGERFTATQTVTLLK